MVSLLLLIVMVLLLFMLLIMHLLFLIMFNMENQSYPINSSRHPPQDCR